MTVDLMISIIMYISKRTVTVTVIVIATCCIKAKMEVHEAPVHGRIICLLLHLGLGLGTSRKKVKGVPH